MNYPLLSDMKKCLLLLTICLYMISCNNVGNKTVRQETVVQEYNDEMEIVECKSDKNIPNGLALGKVVEFKGKTKEETNMLSQFKSYNTALLRGDIDNAKHYMYKDAVVYFRKFYPGMGDDAISNKFFESVSKEMVGQIRRFESHGVELELVVSRIIRKVTQGDNIFYVFEIVSNMFNDNLQLHTTPDLTLAISSNSGKNWTFNAMNEDTPNILRVSHSDDVVDKIMGY